MSCEIYEKHYKIDFKILVKSILCYIISQSLCKFPCEKECSVEFISKKALFFPKELSASS